MSVLAVLMVLAGWCLLSLVLGTIYCTVFYLYGPGPDARPARRAAAWAEQQRRERFVLDHMTRHAATDPASHRRPSLRLVSSSHP